MSRVVRAYDKESSSSFSPRAVLAITLLAIVPVVRPDIRALAMLLGSGPAMMLNSLLNNWVWISLAITILAALMFYRSGNNRVGLIIVCPVVLFLVLLFSTWLSGFKEVDLLLLTFWRIVNPFLIASLCNKKSFRSYCQAWYLYLTVSMLLNSATMFAYGGQDGMYLAYDVTGYGRGYYLYGLDNASFMYALAGAAVGTFYCRARYGGLSLGFLAAYAFIFSAYFYTGAGTAMAIIAVLGFVLILFEITGRPRINVSLTISVCVVGFVLIVLVQNVDAFTVVLELIGKDSTFTGRIAIWEAAFSALKGHELMGFGISPIKMHAALSTVTVDPFIAWQIGHLHNVIIEFLFKGGIIGLMAFLFVSVFPLRYLACGDYRLVKTPLLLFYILMCFTCMFEYRLDTVTFWLIPCLLFNCRLLNADGSFWNVSGGEGDYE